MKWYRFYTFESKSVLTISINVPVLAWCHKEVDGGDANFDLQSNYSEKLLQTILKNLKYFHQSMCWNNKN